MSVGYASLNPATGEMLRQYPLADAQGIEAALSKAARGAQAWRNSMPAERARCLGRLADVFGRRRQELAMLATAEMGKPITAALGEVDKCAATFRWFAEHLGALLASERIDLGDAEAEVRIAPLGVIFAIMPWNFPYWQVARFLAPALAIGNVALLKHAPSVPEVTLAIATAVEEAGFPDGALTTVFATNEQSEGIIADPRIAAVTLTGSERAGRAVGMASGRALKKVVLELGGSDPFIVMPSADIAAAAALAVTARFQNCGQSCIASKRFIVHQDVYDAFLERFAAGTAAMKVGDPREADTVMGPLCSMAALETIERQVAAALERGARVVIGGKRLAGSGAFYAPTILTAEPEQPRLGEEEMFGPVAIVIKARDLEHAIAIANDTPFGLGATVWTEDETEREILAGRLACGMVFNGRLVASDPRVPFGGIGRSGHGRELGSIGVREFANLKTIVTPR